MAKKQEINLCTYNCTIICRTQDYEAYQKSWSGNLLLSYQLPTICLHINTVCSYVNKFELLSKHINYPTKIFSISFLQVANSRFKLISVKLLIYLKLIGLQARKAGLNISFFILPSYKKTYLDKSSHLAWRCVQLLLTGN